jgi:hypothetical protein
MELIFKPNWAIRQQQMGDCVQTVGHLMGWLRREDSPPEGSLNTCLEATIINALNRLDKILGDESAWALPPNDAHTFAAENAALQNGIIHSELQRQTTERAAKIASLEQLTQVLARKNSEAPKRQRRQQKKS